MKNKPTILIVPIIFVAFSILSYWNFAGNIRNNEKETVLPLKSVLKTDKNNKENQAQNIKEMLEFQFNRLKDIKTNAMPKNFRRNELEFAKNLPIAENYKLGKNGNSVTATTWLSEGPNNQGGRTKAIVADITNKNVLLAAAAAGGIWRSTDQGNTWVNTFTPSFVQNVTSLVQDTRTGKTNIWYAGTGELSSNTSFGFLGDGIFKSTDNGVSWNPLPSTQINTPQTFKNRFQIVWNIEIDKVNNLIYAAVAAGIYNSADGGNNWTLAISGTGNYTNVSVNKNGRAYAAVGNGTNNGIYYSDNGTNWTTITPSFWPSQVNRIVTAVSKSNPNILYVIANTPGVGQPGADDEGANGYTSLWKYDASINQWTNLSSNLPTFTAPVSGYTSQGGYDMLIKVKPDDENFVVIGGTNLYRTTDGFSTKLTASDWIGGYATANNISQYSNHHPDQHAFYFSNSNPKIVFSANDGGVSKSTDITASSVTWTSLNSKYISTQFWNVALDKATANSKYILGGMQDNGTMIDTLANSTSGWMSVNSGDGTFAAISSGAQYFYTSSQNANIFRMNFANEWTQVTPKNASNFLFVTPYILDPNNTNVMYILAGNKVWRNSNLTQIPPYVQSPTTVNWSVLNGSVNGTRATALAMGKSSNNLLYVGDNSGKLYKISDASNMSSTFTDISGANFPAGYISTIAVDPNNGNNVFVGFSNYSILSLFFSSDGGTTWNEVGGNLEENADGSGKGPSIRNVKILPVNGGYVYFAATSIGLFTTSNLAGRNTVWSLEAPNTIGNTVVETMDIRAIDGTVIAGTFGKGVYSTKFGTSSPPKPVTDVQTLSLSAKPGKSGNTSFVLSNNGGSNLTYNINVAGDLTSAVKNNNLLLKTNKPGTNLKSKFTNLAQFSGKLGGVNSDGTYSISKSFNIAGNDVLYLDDGNTTADKFLGWGNGTDLQWYNEFNVSGFNFQLDAINFFMRSENASTNQVFVGVYDNNSNQLAGGTLNLNTSVDGTWYNVPLDSTLDFKDGDTFFIELETVGGGINYPAGIDLNATIINKSYFYDGTNWANVNTLSGYTNAAFLIRAVGTKGSGSNQNPTAVADVTPTQANVNDSITFDATGSHDNDGQITTYKWDFGDGTTSSQATATHSYSQANTYTYTLTVTDNGGATGNATGTVTISQSSGTKVTVSPASGSINPGSSQTITLTLDASAVTDGNYKGQVNITTNGGNIVIPIDYTVDVKGGTELPSEFSLAQNYPNPFNPSTVIKYQLKNSSFVSLKIFNSIGQEIKTLVSQKQSAGNYEVNFDAANLSSGVYFYRISAGNFVESKKMILMK